MKREWNVVEFGARPGGEALQTVAFQAALNAARDAGGGRVVVPAGRYVVAGLRMYSNTTLILCGGAELLGSRKCEDYAIIPVPPGLSLRTDQQLFTHAGDRPAYRRAILSAYGEENIAVMGEENAVIDGRDCADPEGEEGFRGPHGLFFSNCRGVTLQGYTVQNTGNFMHQLDCCRNVRLLGVTVLAGHDGAHIHCCENVTFENCDIRSGDDCIAGANVNNLVVRGCRLNSSCHCFRLGGVNVLVENTRMYGPGEYPHRASGRHNLLGAFTYFSSEAHPAAGPAGNWVIRNCEVKQADWFLRYLANDPAALHAGMPLLDVTLENVQMTEMLAPCEVVGDPERPLTIRLKNVCYRYRAGADPGQGMFRPDCKHVTVLQSF